MHYTTLLSLIAFAAGVSAHTTVFAISVNGKDQGDGRGKYIRSPTSNSPIKVLTDANLVCNDKGGTAVSEFVSAAAGDTVSFEWFHNTRGDDIIDGSHKGPINTYIAAFTKTNGAGPNWSKIDEEGLTGSTWAVTKLISNKGKKDVTIPADLAPGQYLLRQEIIALHEADVAESTNSARGAQFYPSCVQMNITGTGTTVPDQKFDFNTGYTDKTPGIVFNIYNNPTSYPIPGPDVFGGSSGASSTTTKTKTTRRSITFQA